MGGSKKDTHRKRKDVRDGQYKMRQVKDQGNDFGEDEFKGELPSTASTGGATTGSGVALGTKDAKIPLAMWVRQISMPEVSFEALYTL